VRRVFHNIIIISGDMRRESRYYWLLLAESHLTRRLFGGMLRKIAALPITSRIGEP
jgi:hypothetical protein